MPTDWNLIDLYYTYLYPIQPVIPKALFVTNVMKESPILLLAMYATASRYHHVNQPSVSKEVIFAEGIKYYKQARNMMDRYLDRPSLQSILALRLLGNFAISTGESELLLLNTAPFLWLINGKSPHGAHLLFHGNHSSQGPCPQ